LGREAGASQLHFKEKMVRVRGKETLDLKPRRKKNGNRRGLAEVSKSASNLWGIRRKRAKCIPGTRVGRGGDCVKHNGKSYVGNQMKGGGGAVGGGFDQNKEKNKN